MPRATLFVVSLAAATALAAGSAQAQGAARQAKVAADAKLRAEAKISEADARATAMKEVPTGRIRSGELERENGRLIYSFDIKVAGKSGTEEVNVDAMTGALVAHEHESDADEKKEAAQDAREKKRSAKP